MISCPSCSHGWPDGARFCMDCGTPLPVAPERKIVTTLICDLVGFTATSEAADPEDIDRLLCDYSDRARKVIESHGGTVEKFIGDAVVGVFGVPAVHEDDPERAVSAGLHLVEALEGMTRPDGSPLQARIGINTGEALVRLDVDPSSGRGFLTGDAVNTAARLQAAAPPMGVAVGTLTHELTERIIEYRELPPFAAKGKAEPVVSWRAVALRARHGVDAPMAELTPLVGREGELSYLHAVFEKAVSQSAPQFALLVGEPGIGKSRLVRELFAMVDARPQMITWRQGYCPPFGEDITYGALPQIVKGHAGILDTDGLAAVEAKLDRVLPSGPDREWFRQRLRALLGLEAPDASREENYTAWMRFFEDAAAGGPLVLVFENLHWADEALLAFLEYLTTHLASVPLLLVGTARPELFERQPGFAAGGAVSRISLGPLSPAETTRLVVGLVGEADERASIVERVVERCEGNPFYAEQSVRLFTDTALEVSLPNSVQAVIAARLDTLTAEQKAILGDAAVVGTVFWDGALAAMGGREPHAVEGLLSELLERQLIRRIRESSLAGECEYAFVHALAREVAYAKLPRLERAKKHVAIGLWVEAKTGDRRDESAEILACHYATALGLAVASSETELADSLLEPAVHYLAVAGRRALAVDVGAAERHLSRASALAGLSSDDSPDLLIGWATVLFRTNRARDSLPFYEKAIARLRESGEPRKAAVAMCERTRALEVLGEPVSQQDDEGRAALDLVDRDEPSPELVTVLTYQLGGDLLLGRQAPQKIVAAADRIVALSEELGLPDPAVALAWRGMVRLELGDGTGLDDLHHAIAAAKEQGLASDLAEIDYNYAISCLDYLGAQAGLEASREGLESASRRGDRTFTLSFRNLIVWHQFLLGDWDEALRAAPPLDAELVEAEQHFDLFTLRTATALMLTLRGQADEAGELAEWLREKTRVAGRPDFLAIALVAVAALNLALGEGGLARNLLHELPDFRRLTATELTPIAVRTCLAIGDLDFAETIVEHVQPVALKQLAMKATCEGVLAEARERHEAAASDFTDASRLWRDVGVPYEEAQALLGQGRCLVALSKTREAREPLSGARAIFERLGARPALEETNELLDGLAKAPHV